jgi:predicted GTPase
MKAPNGTTDCSMILIMGVTGSGKSCFTNKLSVGSVAEGPGLQSGVYTSRYPALFVGRRLIMLNRDGNLSSRPRGCRPAQGRRCRYPRL